jgi:isoleucyl-tRNA synthetase
LNGREVFCGGHMFKPVSSRYNVTTLEEGVLRFWSHNHIFEKSTQWHLGGSEYVFYEGPPTANCKPGVHHALARAFKDIFPRYKSMQGYHVTRRGGWDTHGLPIEIDVERRLGFTSKNEIETYGVARFNELCRKTALEHIQEWENFSDRLGFWVDLNNAYITCTNNYIESVWWILKSFWERGLLYQGYKVLPYCPRCGTPLSDHEVALGYNQAVDPSVFVRMPLVDDPRTSLLIWTTTPWTLPGNVAIAANPDVDYVIIERDLPEGGSEKLILAQSLVGKVFRDEPVHVYETFKGKKLKDLRYRPLFKFILPDKPAYYVVMEDFVTTEDGTGLVHIAPAFGAEDLQASIEYDLPVLMTIEEDGTFVPEVRPWRGKFVKDADPLIVQDLESRGLLYRSETCTHTYPFCWCCDTPLLYFARGTWYIRTSQFKDRMVELNQRINWHPEQIRDGRFGVWLANNVDWVLGRERYWGTPLPIWECDGCHNQVVVGSVEELSRLSGQDLSNLDLHRPAIDQILLPCPDCGGKMVRLPELIDVWFDSGSMPVSQWHYPFENQDSFIQQFPADFICEAVDQTRGWFYSLHAISSLLFDRECFKHAICLGLVMDTSGQKMSRSHGNLIDPWDVLKEHGADALRWYLYTASPPGQERRFSIDLVGEVARTFTMTLWNIYSFFVSYANLDGWSPRLKPDQPGDPAEQYSALDAWILSELHALLRDVTESMETYDVPGATRPIQSFVDILSKWYLRRSRRRFWKSGSEEDKSAAYSTLYEILVIVSKLLAPSMPFLAEELYQNLVRSVNPAAPESIHLNPWPEFDASYINEDLNRGMQLIMKLASLGHSARVKAGIKVRQPLSQAAYSIPNADEARYLEGFADLLEDELNVKYVRLLGSTGEAVSHSLNPLPRQLGQKYKDKLPAIHQAIMNLDQEKAASLLMDGKTITIDLDGERIEILPNEVEVRHEARGGLTVASEGPYLCALDTNLTPELVNEGLAREFVHHIQEARKKADLDIADRIYLYVEASQGLAAAIQVHRDYIMGETLALGLDLTLPPEFTARTQSSFAGETVTFGVLKAV